MKLRIYNKTLDPNLWNEKQELDPEVADTLLQIANDFYESTELKGDIHDILFLGSSANYSWTPTSDIDLHIVIDVAQQNIMPDYARKFMDSLAAKWNNEHEIEVKGHPVEVYLQDLGEPNSSPDLARKGTAIYSLIDKKWILPPNPNQVQIDKEKIQKKFAKLANKINDLVQTEDVNKLKSLMKSIRSYRNAGLAKGGEFSTENLVFKALRRTNWLTKLKDTINTLYDRSVSVNEGEVIRPEFRKGGNWPYVLGKMQDWMEKEIQSGNLQFYFTHLPKLDPHGRKDVLHILEFVEQTYEGGIDGFLADLRAGKITEGVVDVERYLIFGVTNGELHTIAKKYWQSGSEDRHEKLMKDHPDFSRRDYDSLIHWIYKKRNNILYYYGSPTEDQKYVIKAFLEDEYGIKNPIVLKMVNWTMEPYTV